MKGRRTYSRTGLNALKARVKVRGLVAIDRRTAAARDLIAWRNELVRHLGGGVEVTAANVPSWRRPRGRGSTSTTWTRTSWSRPASSTAAGAPCCRAARAPAACRLARTAAEHTRFGAQGPA